MGFYDLTKSARAEKAASIYREIELAVNTGTTQLIEGWFIDADTYIRKIAYTSIGRIYTKKPQGEIIELLQRFMGYQDPFARQTAINAAGEIGKKDFGIVRHFFDQGLLDKNHRVRNAVIGSVKKMGEVNPRPVLEWARTYLDHPDKEIRREICHGIELRGRTHPAEILPMLRTLQFDKTARVRNTLVHVLGQIAYKKNCLKTVLTDLTTWENEALVRDALAEIADVHTRYSDFAALSRNEADDMIRKHFG